MPAPKVLPPSVEVNSSTCAKDGPLRP